VRPAELGTWLDEAHQATQSVQADLGGKRILIFAYLPYWIDYMTGVSAVLVARGADVTFAWLPWGSLDRETPDLDDRTVALFTPILNKPRARFRGINLTATPAELPPASDALKRMARLDTQYVLRREEVDVEGAHRDMFQFRLHRLRLTHATFLQAIRKGTYDTVLLPSGGVVEYAAAWQAAAEAGAHTVTIETWEKRQACAIGFGRPVFSDTAKEIWAADSKVLDDARRARVQEIMRLRESPKWDNHIYSLQNAAVQQAADLRAKLRLDEKRPIALICPNVPYDAAFISIVTGFQSMADWLRTVLLELKDRSDWQVVVRAHPGERILNPEQNAESIVKQVFSEYPEHIHFVAPADSVNTYSLMRMAKVGLVFGSTTGLEMATRGLAVVMPGETHYTRKGFTHDAFTRESYLDSLRKQLDRPEPLTQAQVDLAWCYTDVYMNRWCRPFPWCLGTFTADYRDWPLSRVLSPEGAERFGDTFTILGGGERARALYATPPPITG
jgi:hypothetical protein